MKKFIFGILFVMSFGVNAEQPYSPYNQQYTVNQNYGVSNWMTAFGPGINTAAVTLVGGLVNAMSRPDPVVVQSQQQPQYVQGYPQQAQNGYPQQAQYGYSPQAQYGYPNQGYNYGYQAAPPNPYNQYPQ